MERRTGTELVLIRHAPAETEGRLCGRRDIPARPPALAGLDGLRGAVGDVAHRLSSPAERCRQTARALWPGARIATEPALWEQDFGAWEGLPLCELPDLCPLSPAELAAHRPPGGESFDDLCARVRPALRTLAPDGPGPVALVVHAGTVRAALAMALGAPGAAMAFEVAPLSVTRLRLLPAGGAAVICANCPA